MSKIAPEIIHFNKDLMDYFIDYSAFNRSPYLHIGLCHNRHISLFTYSDEIQDWYFDDDGNKVSALITDKFVTTLNGYYDMSKFKELKYSNTNKNLFEDTPIIDNIYDCLDPLAKYKTYDFKWVRGGRPTISFSLKDDFDFHSLRTLPDKSIIDFYIVIYSGDIEMKPIAWFKINHVMENKYQIRNRFIIHTVEIPFHKEEGIFHNINEKYYGDRIRSNKCEQEFVNIIHSGVTKESLFVQFLNEYINEVKTNKKVIYLEDYDKFNNYYKKFLNINQIVYADYFRTCVRILLEKISLCEDLDKKSELINNFNLKYFVDIVDSIYDNQIVKSDDIFNKLDLEIIYNPKIIEEEQDIEGEPIPENPVVTIPLLNDFELGWDSISPKLIKFLNGDFIDVMNKYTTNLCISDKDFKLLDILKKITIDAKQVNSFNKSYPDAEIKKVYNEENITKFRKICEQLIVNNIYLKDNHVLHIITGDSKFLDT